jgi:hypothetical protein
MALGVEEFPAGVAEDLETEGVEDADSDKNNPRKISQFFY